MNDTWRLEGHHEIDLKKLAMKVYIRAKDMAPVNKIRTHLFAQKMLVKYKNLNP